jgi:acyl-CoA synthetase (AMP-forming)/AMP-acid ligase II
VAAEPHAWVTVSPLGDLLVRAAARHPERDAIVFPHGRRTYAELLNGARRTARGLRGLGIRPGDHVGILMPNCFEFLEAFFATSLLGAVIVPINARYRHTELGYVIENADLVTVLTTDQVEDHVDFTQVLRDCLPSLAGSAQPADLKLPEAPRLRSAVMLHGETRPGFIGRREFDALADTVDPAEVETLRRRVRVRDVAMVVYTSGTTSNPKGCLLTHEAVTRSAVARASERLPLSEHEVYWSSGPLFHIGALAPYLACLGLAGTYLTDEHFDPGAALALMERERVTSAWPLFPAVIQALLGHERFRPQALRSLRSIVQIGPATLLHHLQDLLPWAALVNACGMTETAAMYALSDPGDDATQRAETGGTPLDGIEVRIVDPDTGEDVADGEIGEILVRGYSNMEGYHRDPVKTAEAIDADGWLHTADLYARTPTGHLVFHGRLKDMLKVGGENVAAVEVEAFLCTHPAVRLAEVVGAPDERLDEVPVAFVELHEGEALAPDELIDHCRGRIASFKVPRQVHLMRSDDWPMSATKVDKGALRRRLEALESDRKAMT